MLTASDIMAGKLPRTKRQFNVKGLGPMEIYQLPAKEAKLGKDAMLNKDVDPEKDGDKLESLILRQVYFMLHGEFDDEKSKKLEEVLDGTQISAIYSTGLFFLDLSEESKEQIEKN